MGLVTGLLTLPLAPARGLFWVLDRVVEEAEAQSHDPRRIRADLARAEEDLAAGLIDEETYEAIERDLLARIGSPQRGVLIGG
jgi:Gas vesicle protein G